jgi:hypothetical protein
MPRALPILTALALSLGAATAPTATPAPRGAPRPAQAAPPPAPAKAAAPARLFESHWQDGRAELDGYRYTIIRYGHPRAGQAVMVFVTEPFSEREHVKVDDPARSPADVFEALKLNLVRDFQTGIYDYNTMVSVFTRSRDFSPVKLVLSAMEWCGSVYEEMIFEPRRVTDTLHSYFQGESRAGTLEPKPGGVIEDELFILLRSLRGVDYLAPGARRTLPFLASPFYRRLGHRPGGWSTAEIARLPRAERTQVPAGSFECDVYTVRPADGRQGRFWIERAYPHRVIRWAWTPPGRAQGSMGRDGCDSGELAGSRRLPYWQLHGPGDESYLRELGLVPGAPLPPVGGKRR